MRAQMGGMRTVGNCGLRCVPQRLAGICVAQRLRGASCEIVDRLRMAGENSPFKSWIPCSARPFQSQ